MASIASRERTKIRQVVIITGTPGVGKTTVSEQLATRLGAMHINLGDLVKRERLTSGYDGRRQTWIADTDRLANRLKQILKQPGTLVVDGHYAPSVIPKRSVTMVFVLRRHPRQLKEQLETRGFKGDKLWENIESEILDVCLYDAIMNVGVQKVCEIDTTNKRVEDVVKEILSILDGQKPCITKLTDWLETLERESRLDEYLKHF